jgi:hypothetical protein
MCSRFLPLFAAAILLMTVSHTFGALIVVSDPTRVTGSNAISPNDAALEVSFNATNSTPVGTLTGLSTSGAVQNFAGFTGNQSAVNDYIFTFTDVSLPAVRFRYTGSINTSNAVAIANDGFSTSTNSSMRLQPLSSAGNFTMRIDLGTYYGVNEIFTAGAGVEAVGFTLSGRFGTLTASDLTVTYLDSASAVLSTQILSNAANDVAGYTGFRSVGNPISAIQIDFTGNGGATVPLFGLDDFGFTAIPEPGSMALVACGLLALIALRHRRGRAV